jgi:RNA polymerase sigma-70 factor (ECF subfamily)
MHDAEDDRAIAAVLQGDAEAFGSVVRRYQKPIYNLMVRATGSPEEAADLTQEAFLKAYDRIETYSAGRKFFSWLYTIALNVARDYLRQQKRLPPSVDAQPWVVDQQWSSVPCEEADRLLEAHSLRQALGMLPMDYREALILRFRQGLDMQDIADMLGISVSGAKMRVHRGLEKLRAILGESSHDTSAN